MMRNRLTIQVALNVNFFNVSMFNVDLQTLSSHYSRSWYSELTIHRSENRVKPKRTGGNHRLNLVEASNVGFGICGS